MATAKQRAAARKNIKKAQKANRAKYRKAPVAEKKRKKTASVAAPVGRKKSRATHKKRKAARRAAPRTRAARQQRYTERETSRAARRAHNVRSGAKRHPVRGASHKMSFVPMHLSYEEARHRAMYGRVHRGALENPLTGVELLVGGVSGVVGYVSASFIDRALATRKGATLAATKLATSAPLDLPRAGVGLALTGVPLIAAQFVPWPTFRSALQFFGFAAGFHLAGKGIDMLAVSMMKDNNTVKTLLPMEVDAKTMKDASTVGQPNQGTGALPKRNTLGALAAATSGASTDPRLHRAAQILAANEAEINTLAANAPAVKALTVHGPALRAVAAKTATASQADEARQVEQTYGSSIRALSAHSPSALSTAMGVLKANGGAIRELLASPNAAWLPAPLRASTATVLGLAAVPNEQPSYTPPAASQIATPPAASQNAYAAGAVSTVKRNPYLWGDARE